MSIVLVILLLIVLVIGGAMLRAHIATRKMAEDAETSVPPAGQIQPVEGGAIHFVATGPRDAQPVVMIHGLAGQLQHFTYGLSGLLEDDFRVIALDRPGCGYSERDSDQMAEVTRQAAMIWAFLDKQGIRNPILVGHSLGGAVSLAMALERPDETAALALLCPLTHPTGDPVAVFAALDIKSSLLRQVLSQTFASPMALKRAQETLDAVFAPEEWPKDFLQRGGGALGLRPKAFMTTTADYLNAAPSIERMQKRYADELRVPGGVLFGADDELLAADVHGASMERYGLVSETLPGRGHMIPITAPKDCADFVRRMAAKASPIPK